MNVARLTTLPGLAALKAADGTTLFPESTVRGWMACDQQGFRTACIIKMGGRTMVDLDALEGWLETQRGGKAERRPKGAPAAAIRSSRRHRRDFDEVLREAGLG